jgi:ATP-binding cassette subfamily B protein
MARWFGGRKWFASEVLQTSLMDCGPASLTALLHGFGIPVSYGRLREACQTDVDGTSIDMLEQVAGQLGLCAEQVMLPREHLLLPEAEALPALLVVRLPDGLTHFVIVWRRWGRLVQVMDPSKGRRWLPNRRLLETAFLHTQVVSAADFEAWATSPAFRRPLARRLQSLGVRQPEGTLIDRVAAGPGWYPLAQLEAVTRLVEALVRGGGVRRGREARAILTALLRPAADGAPGPKYDIPESFWSARPAPPGPEGREQVAFRGVVLIRARGLQPAGGTVRADEEAPGPGEGLPGPGEDATSPPAEPVRPPPLGLGPELAAAIAEPTSRPNRLFFRFLGEGNRLALVLLAAGLGLVAAGTLLEAVLFQGAIGSARYLLATPEQRLLAVAGWLGFGVVLLLVERRVNRELADLGRRLELRLRMAFLDKIPRLVDRYFSSRTIADMAARGHAIARVRDLPQLAGRFFLAALTLLGTAAALSWLDPANAPLALLAAALAVGVPLLLNPFLGELELRVRILEWLLSGRHLDAMRGRAAVEAHGAGRVLRREYDGLLTEWTRAGRRFLGWTIAVQTVEAAVGFGLAGWLLFEQAGRLVDAGGVLLLAYWAMNLPNLGQEVAAATALYPATRNTLLGLLEPLGAPEEQSAQGGNGPAIPADPAGVAITLEGVGVQASGHTILSDITAHLPAGSHVAIAGTSGAGKSSLVGLLLGWHRASRGRVLIDGRPLDADRLDSLRAETAWVDPAIQLWNRSLLQNLVYGGEHEAAGAAVGQLLSEADLYEMLQRLPAGLQTPLGEGGGFLSGGEGQRVRFGRALCRADARLVILDEPFRGLDRGQRRELLRRARAFWLGATLLCISHDVGDLLDFERVLVLESSRLVEDGCPARLAADHASHFGALLRAEHAVREGLWAGRLWRRLRLAASRLFEGRSGEVNRTPADAGRGLRGAGVEPLDGKGEPKAPDENQA